MIALVAATGRRGGAAPPPTWPRRPGRARAACPGGPRPTAAAAARLGRREPTPSCSSWPPARRSACSPRCSRDKATRPRRGVRGRRRPLRGRPDRRARRRRQRAGRARGRGPRRHARGHHRERRRRGCPRSTRSAPTSASGSSAGSDVAAVGAALVGGRAGRAWSATGAGRSARCRPTSSASEQAARTPAIVMSRPPGRPAPAPRWSTARPRWSSAWAAAAARRAAEILALVDAALAEGGLAPGACGARLRRRQGRRARPARGGRRARLAAAASRAEELAAVDVPNPSEVVRAAVGTPSVAEAAALPRGAGGRAPSSSCPSGRGASGRPPPPAGPWRPARPATPRGLGPGGGRPLPPRAPAPPLRAASELGRSDSDRYVDSIRHLLRPGTRVETYALGEEVERCRRAGAEAGAGAAVALVSSGDVGVYAMASPALEEAGLASVDVEVVPGVTAANAAAALLGVAARSRPLPHLALRPAHPLGGHPRAACAPRREARLRRGLLQPAQPRAATGSSTRRWRSSLEHRPAGHAGRGRDRRLPRPASG